MVEGGIRCPICQALADPFGDYWVGCGGNRDQILRHESHWNVLYSAVQSAILASRRKVPPLILALRADQQICTCLIGSEVSQLPWKCLSSLQCSSLLSDSLQLVRAMLLLSGRIGWLRLMPKPAGQLESPSSLWWLRHLEDGVTKPQTPLGT